MPTEPSIPTPPFRTDPIPPELIAPEPPFNEEEYLAEVRELQRTGGHRLEDFIDDIAAKVRGK